MTYLVGIDPDDMPTPAELALDAAAGTTTRPALSTAPPVDRADFMHDTEPCVCCGVLPTEPCHPGCDVTYPF